MRVLVYGFSGKILGGIETFILNMNEHMSPNCVFDYVIDGNECVYSELIEKRGGKVFFVPGVRKHPVGYILGLWKILGAQKRDGTELFYYQLFSMANIVPAILAKIKGYKVILHAHNNGLQSKGKVYKVIHLMGKRISRSLNAVHFTNSKLSSDYMFGPNVHSEVIYNAIDLQRFAFCQEARDKVRKIIGSEERIVVGFVGRLSRQKNPVFMLRTFAEIARKVEKCELWIVGEGELKTIMVEEIEKLDVGDKIKWLGRRGDVNELMMGMDLLLQPSLFEGLGIVLIEAQATGLPVITSKDVIPEEAVATPLIKFVSLDDNPSTWADKCISLIKDIKKEKRENETKGFPASFDINKEAVRLENLLNK